MCKFKSGIIFKNRVELTPTYNDSHSDLLERLGIEDDEFNAQKVFVRAELLPPDEEMISPVSEWKFNVDQDIVPDWFSEDRKRYEDEFRTVVSDWLVEKTVIVAGERWFKLKETEEGIYCVLARTLMSCEFGDNNDYRTSVVRERLLDSSLAKKLEEEYRDKLIPISISLTSIDGMNDYGQMSGDYISLMDLDLFRECAENIKSTNWCWLATPDSTKSKLGTSVVCCISNCGFLHRDNCSLRRGVLPFCIFSSL